MADDPLESHLQSLLVQPSSSSKTLDLDLEQDQRGSREALQASLDALGAYEPSASDSLRELDTEYGGVQSASGSSSLWNALYDAAQADLNREDVVQSYSEEMEPEAAIEATSGTPVARLRQHLAKTYPSDLSLSDTVLSTVTDLLASTKSADEVSVELAELLGFDQLELVSELLGDRQGALRSLSAQGKTAEPDYDERFAPSSRNFRTAPEHHADLRASAKPYTPGSQVVVQTQDEIAESKRLRAEYRRAQKSRATEPSERGGGYTFEELERIREESLQAAASRPLFSGTGTSTDAPQYPHVFSSGAHGNTLSVFGEKFALPVGTSRTEREFYEEITIPPPRTVPMRLNERLVPIQEMDPLCRGAFPGYKSLNRLQSVVYPLGYRTNENLLVCAPTGAGKTDVAMLTVLRCISQYARNLAEPALGTANGTGVGSGNGKAHAQDHFGIAKNDFKIIYVAPMKALAAEIVRKFSKRLQYLGIKVRELTGDMQLTRQEIAETQMIVTTPEKWDVVTRKPTGEGELAQKVKLLIIDEVHLLHEDRGAVIESIVARTLRLVESSQSLIRIVGLSATLPNYVDVADFLRVNRYQGLFYFDSSFRPVPLEQHFIGVKGKPGSPQSRGNLDKATFEKVSELVQAGHQVMVFVHARKETVKTAQMLRELANAEGIADFFNAGKEDHPRLDYFKKELGQSRNREMKELFDHGFGIHHAGMLRSDRNLSERMFEANITKVLCCTATLAWGVNLPAYAVVIKGTQVYDSSKGAFVDLSILDVLQIFGRAGRPQYEDLGVGYICTTNDKLSHYVDAITSQHPIESKFINGMIDSLNAEVALGTVNNVDEGVSWLGYTYLFTRMKRNPLTYGMEHSEPVDDPHLGAKRLQLITSAAKKLVEAKMLSFDDVTGRLTTTDLGRIASKYYIPHRTIEIFNEKLRPRMSEADVISLLSLATDFEQIIPRDSEEAELKKMLENAPCEVKDGTVTSPGKVNILLQGYVSRVYVEDFALVSDSAYVAQNAGRIIRALLEIALSRKWAPVTSALMAMSKAVERRMWPFDHPLAQSSLSPDTIFNLTRWADEVEISELANMSAADLGEMIHLNERLGGFVRQAARQFPALRIEHALRPLTHDLLRIVIDVSRAFEWKERMHGGLEPFYVWIEDEAGIEILQWANVLFRPHTSTTTLSFVVPISKPQPRWLSIRWISDRWLGSEDSIPLRLDSLIMPAPPSPHLALLDLPLLPISALQDPVLSALYSQKLAAFNALQTQCFHTLMHSRANTLLCGPTASGKSTIAQMAIWRALRKDGNASVLVMHPHRILARRAADQFRNLFGDQMGLRVRLVSTAHEMDELSKSSTTRTVVFATPLVLGRTGKSGKSLGNALDGVALIIAEDLHLLDPAYELALSRLCQQALESGSESGATRIVGTSASLHDATGLAAWLGVKEASIYSFHPKDRPSMLQTNFQSFDFAHSIALLKTMVKPTYDRIKSTAISGPAIVFVPSRMQCLSTAADLITRSASEMDTEAFMGAPSQDLEPYLQNLRDGTLREPLMHGIGVYHEGMAQRDQLLILQLFEQGIIHVIIAPREACWSLPVRAHLVVIMGTQYVRLLSSASAGANANANANANAVADRKVTDYALTEVARMQSLAIRAGTPSSPSPPGECLVLCQADQVDYLCRMLTGGLPLESALLDDECEALLAPLLADIASDKVDTRSKAVEELSWTYLSRQLERNPSYYDCEKPDGEYTSARLSRAVDAVFETLLKLACIRPVEENDKGSRGGQRIAVTDLGKRLVDQNRPGAVVRLAELCVRLSADPAQAGVLFKGFENTSGVFTSSRGDAEKEKEQKVEQVGIDVLAATRDRIPGEWLAAFVIPKAARAGKDKSQSQIKGKGKATSSHKDQEHPVEKGKPESDGTTGGNDNASANASINGKDERDANDGSTQLKGTPTERRAILLAAYFSGKPIYTPAESASIQSSRGGSKGKGKDQGADTEAAISDNASSVQANGRPKNDLYERERESLRRRQGELVGKMLDALEGPGPAPAGSGVVRRNGEAPKIARREGASSRR